MSADKDARIAELERTIEQLEDRAATAYEMMESRLTKELAEQQAILKRIREVYSHGDDLDTPLFESVKLSGDTELNNLLAKAKEEGRKEAVQVRIDLLNWLSDCGYLTQEADALHKDSMLFAAPKPQGELEQCQTI